LSRSLAARKFTVGLISDTHGLLRPGAVEALRGSDFIVHAGDIGDPAILAALVRLAPLTAVRGNVDRGSWAAALPETAVLTIGDANILAELSRLAPVTAVRGNVDRGDWAAALPETAVLQIGDAVIFVIHNLAALDRDPLTAGFRVVVSGHSHHPAWREQDGVLFVNPGSAGPRRFTLPIALGRLRVAGKRMTAELVELES